MADIKEMIQMKKRHFDVETDGFYGAYWKCKTGSDCAMIAMIGDDPEDYLARTSVKWLHKLGVFFLGHACFDYPAAVRRVVSFHRWLTSFLCVVSSH